MIDYRYLPAFYAVARDKSFTRAGKALHIATSAVTRQIQLLEESCGKTLFIRADREILLTDSGKKLLAELKIFQDASTSLFNGDATDLIRIGTLEGILHSFVAPIIGQPSLKTINIELKIAHPSELLSSLGKGEIDLTFFSSVHKTSIPTGMQVYRLFREEIVLISKDEVSLESLINLHWIIYTKNTYLVQYHKKMAEHYTEVANMSTVVNLVRAGRGVAMVPLHTLSGIKGIVVKPVQKFSNEQVFLIMRKEARVSKAIKEFIEVVKSRSPEWKLTGLLPLTQK